MRVALDARMIGHSGIGTALRAWLEGLAALDAGERPSLVLIGEPDALGPHARALNAEIIPFGAAIYSLGEQLRFPSARGRWDVLHVPHYAHPVFYRGPFLGTVHDRFHIKYGTAPKRAYQRWMLRRLRARGCPILTVSRHSKRELEDEGFAQGRVHVIHHGLPRSFLAGEGHAAPAQARKALGLPAQYVLWIGIGQPHKNLARLLEAMPAVMRRVEIPLVLAGLSPHEAAAARARLDPAAQKSVFIIGRFPEPMKRALIGSAHAFVFPSLDEGFGLPPLEAMALGVPCAVSDRPPMNELYGGAMLGFDPLDVGAMAGAIERVVADAALRAELIESGHSISQQFSCEESARALVCVWRQCLADLPEAVRA